MRVDILIEIGTYLGGARPAPEVRHGDDGQQRAEVVGARDDSALRGARQR